VIVDICTEVIALPEDYASGLVQQGDVTAHQDFELLIWPSLMELL
jgi:hypothetical protein